MTKRRKGLFTFLCAGAILAVTLLTACAGGYKSGAEVGKYYFDYNNDEYNITLIKDGKIEFKTKDKELKGDYSIEGDTIKISLSDKTKLEGTYKDEVLKVKYNDIDMSFIRDIDYTVTFDSNGGSKVASVTVKNGRTVTKPEDPTREQYAFVGWTITKDGNDLFSFNDTKVTKNLTIYGKWSYIDIVNKLTYKLPEGMSTTNPTINVVEGKDYVLEVPKFSDNTKVFDGWYLEDGTRLTDNNGKSLAKWNPELGNVNVVPRAVANFSYTLLADGSYSVSSSDALKTSTILEIPSEYNGKPVTEVKSLQGLTELTSITISENLRNVNPDSFLGLTKLIEFVAKEGMSQNSAYSVVDGVLYTKEGKTLVNYPIAKEGTEFVVPNKVTEIGDYAFKDYAYRNFEETSSTYGKLTKVTLPKNITRVGISAFEYRGKLSTVEFVAGGTLGLEFDKNAFKGCGLRNFTLPSNLKKIGDGCFSVNREHKSLMPVLGDVVLPTGFEYLGNEVFYDAGYLPDYSAKGIRSIVFNKDIKFIGSSIFENTRIDSVTFEDGFSYKELPDRFLAGTPMLEEFVIPASIKTIGFEAFTGMGATTLVVPNGVEVIKDRAFSEMENLESITLPASIKVLGAELFVGSYMITFSSINIDKNNPNLVFEQGIIYNKDKTKILLVDTRSLTDYVMPDTITVVPAGIFKNAEFASLTLSKNLTEIGANAFRGATVTKLVIPANVKKIGDGAFADLTFDSFSFEEGSKLEEIGANAFESFAAASINLPSGLKRIGANAFTYSELESIIIPDSVEYIGDKAFSGAWALTEVVLPLSLKEIGFGVFSESASLSKLSISPESKLFKVVDNVLYSKDLKKLYAYPEGLAATSYNVLSGVEEILDHTFEGNSSLTEVVLPATLKRIGKNAFKNSSITKINLENVNEIDEYAFAGTKLTSITLSSGLSVLNKGVFESISTLTEVNLGGVKKINAYAFNNCQKLTKLVLVASIINADKDAFAGNKLTELVIDSQAAASVASSIINKTTITSISVKDGLELDSQALEFVANGFTKTAKDGYTVYTKNIA